MDIYPFVENKYARWYTDICSRGQMRKLPDSIYTERHHVVPRCLNGSDDDENITTLTFKEHFIAHKLLPKMVENRDSKKKLYWALFMMRINKKSTRNVTSRIFEECKQAGRKAKLLEKRITCIHCGKTITKSRHTRYHGNNCLKSPIAKINIHKVIQLRKPSDSHRLNSANGKMGKPPAYYKITCLNCKQSFFPQHYSQWHGPKCRVNL